jgi:hypothetical protein
MVIGAEPHCFGVRQENLTPLFWSEIGERKVFGPDILKEAER